MGSLMFRVMSLHQLTQTMVAKKFLLHTEMDVPKEFSLNMEIDVAKTLLLDGRPEETLLLTMGIMVAKTLLLDGRPEVASKNSLNMEVKAFTELRRGDKRSERGHTTTQHCTAVQYRALLCAAISTTCSYAVVYIITLTG